MSADKLHRAAALLRERAEKATAPNDEINLALADWLDGEAQAEVRLVAAGWREGPDTDPPHRVARLILGEAE